ncbi:MAG: glycerophosphodiester phosphodiesterase [Jatrophihabitans sp.]|uniref:glycerophosphodiester phosphodiesterase n=1 Tax=Jatrophihabitans sp. TaxID=1932789 RepID=UPI003F816912
MTPRPLTRSGTTRPFVVAHRGASWAVAEHTLAAYEAAIDSGADDLECDVRLTRDGHLVCVHDRTINRTSSSRGVVSEFALDELSGVDFESWYGELPHSADHLLTDSPYLAGVAPDHVRPGAGVLTLETLLELVRDAPRRISLLIETKHPTRYGGLVEKTLVETLARFGWAGPPGPPASLRQAPDPDAQVIVMSFAPTAIRRVRLQAPALPTVLLLERLLLPTRRGAILPPGTTIAGPGLHVLQADPDFVARAHARGHRVFVWTVDEPDEVEFVRDLGVDTIITNRPAEVLEQLGG